MLFRSRESNNAEIELEIQELQSSLDRRHRRGSDHFADLTYEDQEGNYDVPQAPLIGTIEPRLQPIPPLPIKEPKESVGLIDFKRVLSLDGKITGDIAENSISNLAKQNLIYRGNNAFTMKH